MKKSIVLSKYLKVLFQTESKEASEWFGYYNYDTLNYDQTKMIALHIPVDGVAPSKDISVQIGYYDLHTAEWCYIDKSDSWNWQQGAMAQWLPNNRKENIIIYNNSIDGRLVSILFNVDTGERRIIDWPIYGIMPDGSRSISIDLERSYWCRAYHYQSVVNKDKDGLVWKNDGVYEIDLINNTRKTIVDIDTIIHTEYKEEFKNCKHWLEHVMINPSGTKFCFLHRFSSPENVYRYSTRLFVADIDGSNLQVVPGWEDTIFTHFGWKTNDEFAIYTYTPYKVKEGKGLREIVKTKSFFSMDMLRRVVRACASVFPYAIRTKMIGRRTYYQFYKLGEGDTPQPAGKAEGKSFSVDGHPSFTNDGRYMITDSYPWNDGFQRLMVIDTKTGKSLIIAKFFAYYHNNPASCDLHPKLSANNRLLAVDTAYDEHHHMILFELDWGLIKKEIS